MSRRKNVPGLDSQVGDKLYIDVVKKPPQGYSNARLKEIYSRLEENIYAEAGNGQAYPEKSRAYPENPENPDYPFLMKVVRDFYVIN